VYNDISSYDTYIINLLTKCPCIFSAWALLIFIFTHFLTTKFIVFSYKSNNLSFPRCCLIRVGYDMLQHTCQRIDSRSLISFVLISPLLFPCIIRDMNASYSFLIMTSMSFTLKVLNSPYGFFIALYCLFSASVL